jgi:hypothetical protein
MSIHENEPQDSAAPQEHPLFESGEPTVTLPVQPPTTTAPSTPSVPSVPSMPSAPEPRARLRVGTVVWGLVLAVIGAGVLAGAFGVGFDLGLALIWLVGFAGVALLVGSVASGMRSRKL